MPKATFDKTHFAPDAGLELERPSLHGPIGYESTAYLVHDISGSLQVGVSRDRRDDRPLRNALCPCPSSRSPP